MFRIRRRMPPSEWDQDPKIDPSPQELGFPPTEPQNVGPVFRAPDRAWNPGFVAGLFLILGTAYLAVAALLTTATLYPGQRNTGPVPPSSLGAEHLVVWNADSVLAFSAWTVPGVGDKATGRAIVLVHELGDDVWNDTNQVLARAYADAGFTVFAIQLRAHGISDGEWLGLSWHEREDIRAAVDFLLGEGFLPGRIGIHGTAYGAATALLAAAAIPEIGAVVADSAFADIRNVMFAELEEKTDVPAAALRLFGPGITFIAQLVFDLNLSEIPPLTAVPAIAPRPILFIHGEDDTRVPVEQTRALFHADLSTTNDLWVLPGMGHTEGIWSNDGYKAASPIRAQSLARVTDFFDRTLP